MNAEIDYKCERCGTVKKIKRAVVKGSYNWKCDNCNKITPFGSIAVIWNCDPGTAPRGKDK